MLIKKMFLFVVALFFMQLLLAQTDSKSDSLYWQSYFDSIQHLPEVEVVAQSFKEVIPAQTMKGVELEMLRSHSVADALRYFSGVQLKDYGGVGGIKTVNIRSMGTNHMGVYYNGIELGNAQNGQVDLGKYSLENIEAVSLYNGQKSDIFQSAREFGSAGSIYLTTRFPKFKEGEQCHLRAGLRAGSFDLLNPSITFEYKLCETVSASFNAEWVNASGKYKFRYRRVTPSGELAYDTTAVRQNGDLDAVRFEGGVHGYLPNGRWKAYLYHYNSERGVPGAIVNNVWRRGERLWDRNSFVQGMFEYDITNKLQTKVNAKYAFDYTRYVNNDDKLIHVDNTYKQKEVYLSWANKYEILRNWDVSMAYDFQWNGLSEYMYVDRTTHWLSVATAFSLGDCFKLQASGLMTYVNEEQRDRDSAPDKVKFTPGVFMSYKPFKKPNFVVRAFYKQSYRMPTFNDLYYTEVGNSNLKPENTHQWDLGLIYAHDWYSGVFRHLELKADGYFNLVDNKIVAIPKGSGQYRWKMMNVGKVHIAGFEATAEAALRLHRDWYLLMCLNYTYQSATDHTDPTDNDPYYGTYGKQIAYVPWHSGSVAANLNWKDFGVNYSFIYVGERYHTNANIRENYEQPWYTHDISATYSLRYRGCKITLGLECNNMFNLQYDVIQNYPMPGRNWKGTLKLEF